MPSASRISAGVGAALLLTFGVVVACSDERGAASGLTSADASGDGTADAADASDGGPDGDGAACVLAASYGSRSCNACMLAHCCDVISTCDGEAACKPLQKCVTDCLVVPDAGACRTACLSQYPDGKTRWLEVEACWFNDPPRCGVACT